MYFFSKPPSIFLEQRKTVHVVIVYHSVSRSIIPLYPRHTAINFEKPSNNVIVHNMSNIPTYPAANKSRNENHPSINDGSVYRPIIIRMAAIKGATSLVQDPSKTARTSGGLLRSSKRALRGFEALSKKKGEVQAPCTEATDSISLHCFKSACRDTTTLLPIPIESPSLSQENSRSSRSWYEVTNQSPRGFPSFLPSPDTLP